MKNTGIVVDNDFNNDIRVRREVEILKKNGFEVSVLCFGFDKKTYPPIDGVNIRRIRIKKKIKDILFFLFNRLPLYELIWEKEIRKFIKRDAIQILHVHDLYMAKSAGKAIQSLKSKIPLILDLHENFPYAIQSYNWTKGKLRGFVSKPKAWIKKEGKYLRYASKIIVLSELFKNDLLERYKFLNANNIVVFPNVIDLRRFEEYKVDESVVRSDKVTLMYFGAVAERRGIFDAIDVLEKCLNEKLNIDFLIIGPVDKADKESFFSQINKEEIRDSITYIPWIDVSELNTYMYISDIFLSPLKKNKQHESGVANKIYQYMYGGKPIIVSDCKPQKKLVESFNCGLSYSTQEEFFECVKKLVENKELRETLGANGFKKLYENYDNESYDNILIGLYNEFLLIPALKQ
ncbi:MAG: glycosyltransferase family 4 protein [Lentimicrobiaceae bacterium]|nr:glycosyltransferase family 4 protein [Lentimicrobiaceae bacterium]